MIFAGHQVTTRATQERSMLEPPHPLAATLSHFLRYADAACVADNVIPHPPTTTDVLGRPMCHRHNVELAYVPLRGPWLDRVKVQFTALPTSPSTAPTTTPPPAGQHAPQLHRLAEPARHQSSDPAKWSAEPIDQDGEGCLTRH